jgi:hypothetical protein
MASRIWCRNPCSGCCCCLHQSGQRHTAGMARCRRLRQAVRRYGWIFVDRGRHRIRTVVGPSCGSALLPVHDVRRPACELRDALAFRLRSLAGVRTSEGAQVLPVEAKRRLRRSVIGIRRLFAVSVNCEESVVTALSIYWQRVEERTRSTVAWFAACNGLNEYCNLPPNRILRRCESI